MWFPSQVRDISAEWLENALIASGLEVEPGSLSSIAGDRIGTGLVGLNIRYELRWAQPGRGLPQTLVVKLPSTDPTSRATGIGLRNYEREVRFYREIAGVTAARLAKCFAAEWDPDSGEFILVLEDLAPGEVGDQMRGCTVQQAELAVDVASAIHGSWWTHPKLAAFGEWMSGPYDEGRADQLLMLWEMAAPQFLQRHPGVLTSAQSGLLDKLGSSLKPWLLQRQGPWTLTHGDFRVDNMIFGPDWMVPVDWQTPGIGIGAADVAYFLGASLLPDDRRTHEERLVRRWHEGVVTRGVKDYPWDQCWRQYRSLSFAGVVMGVAASMITQQTERGDEMFLTMVTRHLDQAADLQSVDVL